MLYEFDHTFKMRETSTIPSISSIIFDPNEGLIRTDHELTIEHLPKGVLHASGKLKFHDKEIVEIDYGNGIATLYEVKNNELRCIETGNVLKNTIKIYRSLLVRSYEDQVSLRADNYAMRKRLLQETGISSDSIYPKQPVPTPIDF